MENKNVSIDALLIGACILWASGDFGVRDEVAVDVLNLLDDLKYELDKRKEGEE